MASSSTKQLLFGPRTVQALGSLLLVGIAVLLVAWLFDSPQLHTIGFWLTVPFLTLIAILILVVLPYTWWQQARRRS